MDSFYSALFAPVVAEYGAIDTHTLMTVIGFDGGGLVSLCTVGRTPGARHVTYLTCELALRSDQCHSDFGRYELLMTCDDEGWCWEMLTKVGRMSCETAFGDGHTLDIGPVVDPTSPVQGFLFQRFSHTRIKLKKYGILRLHGISRRELETAQARGANSVLQTRKRIGIYPRTTLRGGT